MNAYHSPSSIYLFLLIFVSTLGSFYRYDLGFSLDHLALILIVVYCVFINRSIRIDRNLGAIVQVVLLLCFFGVVFSIAYHDTYSFSLKVPLAFVVYSTSVAFFIKSIGSIVDHSNSIKFYCPFFTVALAGVIVVHAAAVFIQLSVYLIYDSKLDFVFWFSGEESRNEAGYFLGYTLFRPSGLFVEPGTFSAYQSMLVLMYMLMYSNRQRIVFIGLLSIAMTLSAQGIIYILVILISNFRYFVNSGYKHLKYFLFLPLATLLMIVIFYDRFLGADSVDPSAVHRYQSIEDFVLVPFTGVGFTDIPVLGASSSLFLYLYSFVGVFGIAALVSILFHVRTSHKSFVSLLLLFLTKIVPTGPFFYLCVYIFILNRKVV